MNIEIDKKSTAIVVIDLQKGIVSMPTEPYSVDTITNNAVKLVQTFRKYNMPVFLVHVGMSADFKDALQPKNDQPMQSRSQMAPDWTEFITELGPEKTDFIINKRQWGAFYGTELDLQLRRRQIKTIVLCGISTNIGVESTARFAYEYGYQQIFAEDACGARSKEEHNLSMKTIFSRIGLVRQTKDILKNLE
jgi:nicotinamidase-related amidase